MNIIEWILFCLATLGAINWGLVGLLNFNLVEALLGSVPMAVKIVYGLIGLAGVSLLIWKLNKAFN